MPLLRTSPDSLDIVCTHVRACGYKPLSIISSYCKRTSMERLQINPDHGLIY